MRYRLALDLGSTSLGWAMVRLNDANEPHAIIKAGVRIFSDGRNPKDGSSLAVTRRDARAMRRRRDRLLKRKSRMMANLVEYGFFPVDPVARKEFELLDPYELRARGLNEALQPSEFARALFHINQRRGFKSNRKTDKKDNDAGALKTALKNLRAAMVSDGSRTVGEWLYKRHTSGQTVRARYRQTPVKQENGKTKIDKSYDLYIDRAMIEAEFDALWSAQTKFNSSQFTEDARLALKDCLLHQRPLKPVKPGRCTLLPDEERAPLALPSTQQFRMYQEVNNLRILGEGLSEGPLTLAQRNLLVTALEQHSKRSFTQIKRLLDLSGAAQFNFEDPKRQELKGNTTSAILSKTDYFGATWFDLSLERQDEIVGKLVNEENETLLINWLQNEFGFDERKAEKIANAALPEGYGSLCAKALVRILPELKKEVVTYDKALVAAGFEHHSNISHAATGEILPLLPYYGEYLQRHVGFGTGVPEDHPEKRYGKIANPTVHIGLNQIRVVVNALIKRYGHPSEVIVELARDLKQSQEQRKEDNKRQTENQNRNARLRQDVATALNISAERVRRDDIQKMLLWEELSHDAADRRCPYSGVQISVQMLLSDQVEIEHILPFSQTLDDGLNNKTVAMRQANRIKGNRTPWEARNDFAAQGWNHEDMLARAEKMPKNKRYRFGDDGYQRWLREDKTFLARALNDTRHLSRVAREYMSLICPQNTRVIPGQMTAMLRSKFGLNDILGLYGEKNRNDHRHHAVDACVIAVTDQSMLQRFAKASANAREQHLTRLVENMPLPWDTYRDHVARAINAIFVSHKPDHGHEGAMHNDTAYGLLSGGVVRTHKIVDGIRQREDSNLKVIEMTSNKAPKRHGLLPDGSPRPYKGYKGDSNYCMEIYRTDDGKWASDVISTFQAYQIVRHEGVARLRNPRLSLNGKHLVMRLLIGDTLRLEVNGRTETVRIQKLAGNGQIFLASHQEANVDARNRDASDTFAFVSKMVGSLRTAKGRRVTVSPIGEVKDKGFVD
ncbi:CRISPR-associated Csn1 family endonuclease [Jezberella montanilacus]|uniref:CRISPR-associated endonuclease Cas9 n=2 Tax=Jezberella montanilacus TaxID=323426 RepID=A0A2T0XFI4_9BURK|nr:CRISPR-associated Csn1 family endonuclease [Jezberella montanilacus]